MFWSWSYHVSSCSHEKFCLLDVNKLYDLLSTFSRFLWYPPRNNKQLLRSALLQTNIPLTSAQIAHPRFPACSGSLLSLGDIFNFQVLLFINRRPRVSRPYAIWGTSAVFFSCASFCCSLFITSSGTGITSTTWVLSRNRPVVVHAFIACLACWAFHHSPKKPQTKQTLLLVTSLRTADSAARIASFYIFPHFFFLSAFTLLQHEYAFAKSLSPRKTLSAPAESTHHFIFLKLNIALLDQHFVRCAEKANFIKIRRHLNLPDVFEFRFDAKRTLELFIYFDFC